MAKPVNELKTRLRNLEANTYELHEAADVIDRLQTENQALRSALAKVIKISDRKHDAWDAAKALLAKCPECGSPDYIRIDREGDMLAPEATYFVCNDCGHESDPE